MATVVGAQVGLDAKTVQRPERIVERLAALEASGNVLTQIARLQKQVNDLQEIAGSTPSKQEILSRKMAKSRLS